LNPHLTEPYTPHPTPLHPVQLAISDITYDEIFNEPIGEVVISDLPMQLLVVDVEKIKVKLWIPPRSGKL
jgi:hypothetical protein